MIERTEYPTIVKVGAFHCGMTEAADAELFAAFMEHVAAYERFEAIDEVADPAGHEAANAAWFDAELRFTSTAARTTQGVFLKLALALEEGYDGEYGEAALAYDAPWPEELDDAGRALLSAMRDLHALIIAQRLAAAA